MLIWTKRVPIACEKRAWGFCGGLGGSQPSAWIWAWSRDSPRFMRRHPPHHLSPARANHPAGQDPEARLSRSTSPQQRSDQHRKPVISEQESCSYAVACAEIGSTGSKFESSRPSQAVWRSEKMSLILTERPANGGLLRISHQSPGYDFGHFLREIANSLRRTFEKLPFLGDRGRRPGSICSAWPSLQCNSPNSPPWPPAS
jgi:hypothetical protein